MAATPPARFAPLHGISRMGAGTRQRASEKIRGGSSLFFVRSSLFASNYLNQLPLAKSEQR
jgi:hypothetical protein